MRAVVSTALVLMITAAACGNTPEVTQVPTAEDADLGSTTEPAPPSTTEQTTTTAPVGQLDELAVRYFEAIATSQYQRDSGLAERGSLADAYGYYLTEVEKAAFSGNTSRVSDVGVDYVTILTNYDDGTDEIVYTDIEVSQAGVVGFTVNGTPIGQRLSLNTQGVETSSGVNAADALLYLTASGSSRIAMVTVDNKSASEWNLDFTASLVTSDGTQDDSVDAFGTDVIRPGATGLVFFVFDGDPTTVAGEIYVDGWVNDFSTEASMVVPVS